MPTRREVRLRIREAIEWCEPKLALVALACFGAAALLGKVSSEYRRITAETAERIDYVCLGFGGLTGVLALWAWRAKRTGTGEVEPPYGSALPRVIQQDQAGVVFFTGDAGQGGRIRFSVPNQDRLEMFVKWSDEDEGIAETSGLKTYERRRLYGNWYHANPRHFLVMDRKHCAEAEWEPVGISIVLALPRRAVINLERKELAVVNLLGEDLTFTEEERENECLLYDTLIFSRGFRKEFSEFKRWHSLMHLAQFASPTAETPVKVWIEPDNPRLATSISKKRYGAFRQFELASEHTMFEFFLPDATNTVWRMDQFVMLWKLLRVRRLQPETPGGRAVA